MKLYRSSEIVDSRQHIRCWRKEHVTCEWRVSENEQTRTSQADSKHLNLNKF